MRKLSGSIIHNIVIITCVCAYEKRSTHAHTYVLQLGAVQTVIARCAFLNLHRRRQLFRVSRLMVSRRPARPPPPPPRVDSASAAPHVNWPLVQWLCSPPPPLLPRLNKYFRFPPRRSETPHPPPHPRRAHAQTGQSRPCAPV